MNYELAKKLKDAGFPQAGHGSIHTLAPSREENMRVLVGEEPKEEKVYIPNLSELIEASGEKFTSLHYDGTGKRWDSWSASSWDEELQKNRLFKYGSTPEEAVANLWLALNGKKL